ncbi:NADH-cytochrome b5 reductase 2-like [Haemaphysalis longicornis]
MRPYTPVSLCDQRGSFDIIVKVYMRGTSFVFPAGGTMSQLLDHLKTGDAVQVQGPKGKFRALGRGQFVTEGGTTLYVATHLGLVAAGSGVTPMLQLLRHRFADLSDFTRITMVDVNHSEQDIIVRDELEEYAKKDRRRFKICHVLDDLPEKIPKATPVQYKQGPLTQAILEEMLPPPGPLTLVLLCGPPRLISEVCRPALRNIGHDPMRVLAY